MLSSLELIGIDSETACQQQSIVNC